MLDPQHILTANIHAIEREPLAIQPLVLVFNFFCVTIVQQGVF